MGRIGFAAALMLLICAAAQAQTRTWQYAGAGKWEQLAQASTAPVAPDPQLDRVETLLASKSYKRAAEAGIRWVNSHKTSPLRDRALFLIGNAWYGYGDRIKSFYYFDELLDEHPGSHLYAAALQRQFDIADSYLRGYKQRFLGVPMFTAEDDGVEMLYRIQQRAVGSPIAEKALLRTADYYFADRQYDLAGDAYAAFMRSFPRSPQVPRARLKQAYSSYAQFHGPRYEVAPLLDARAQLTAVMNLYPQLAEQENIPSLIEEIDRALARKLYVTGDFYRRTHQARAAAYTYTYLTKAFPASVEAQQARNQLKKLPQWAMNFPQPKMQGEAGTETKAGSIQERGAR